MSGSRSTSRLPVPDVLGGWNWRQGTRTRITTGTTSAVFILDALDPLTDDAAHAAADTLTDALLALSPDATVHRRLLHHPHRTAGGVSS